MDGGNVFSHESINPFILFGWTHSFFEIHKDTIVTTWITIAITLVIVFLARLSLAHKNSSSRFLVLSFIRAFKNLCVQSMGQFNFHHFSFVVTIFIFMCNVISVLPWLEEPTRDLNTTLALGLISFLYAQASSIKVHGIAGHIKEYFKPFALMFPLHVMGNVSNIVSISFRLFGNIFGGSIIVQLYTKAVSRGLLWQVLTILSGVNILVTLFFSLFEGFIQAFVFSI